MKPFLKWAGSKTRLVESLRSALPAGSRLVEPFLGSGAVFLGLEYPAYLLADGNRDLISLYQHLQREGEPFIESCRELFGAEGEKEEAYYARREEFNTTRDLRRKAALFVYLNRHCFNGLCRYSRGGGFNVPFGRYRAPYFPEAEMRAFHQKAERVTFLCQDFRATLRQVRSGDVVYLDPPYVPLTQTASFTTYSAQGFGEKEQRLLAREAERLVARGIPVVISNHDTELTRRLYHAASTLRPLEVRRSVSGKGTSRFLAPEVIAIYTPQPSLFQWAS